MSSPAFLLSFVVGDADTAIALGSGDVPVLATPRLIAWLEAATVQACADLSPGETSVGTRVDIEHLAASPVGARVDALAEVVHRDGRLLRFAVTAHHDVGEGSVLIAQGHVTRIVVRRESFLARALPHIVIREALPDELVAVARLRVEAYEEGYGLSDEPDSYRRVLMDAAAQAAEGEVLVALRDGDLVGTVTVIHGGVALAEVADPGEVEFRFMAVAPHAWRQGIAKDLLDAVVARAGARPLVCCVIEGNDPATELYLSAGFERLSERDREPAPGVVLRAFTRRSHL